ncbi:MAG TPA: DUF6807 family protein [Terracidiphilus sp.]
MHGKSAAHTPVIKLVRHELFIDVRIDGALFTTYHFNDDYVLPRVRPFFYPVLAADGTEMTIDHAQHPPLHAYQRSVWIGAGDVNGADHWKFKAKPVPKQRHIRFDWVNRNGFQEELLWEDATGAPMLKETRTVAFLAFPDGARQIDFSLRFSPIDKSVTFFNRADHGILSVRPNPEIAGNPTFTASDHTADCNQHITWCDESGQIGGRTYGIAMFDAPTNPRNPPLWHAGKDQRLATDIFLTHPGARGSDPDRATGDFTIRAGESVVFRYGVLFHPGNSNEGNVEEHFQEFEKTHADISP